VGKIKVFTTQDKEYLINNYGKISIDEIAKHINRNKNAIYKLVTELGIGRYQWTENRLEILKELYPYGNYVLLMEKLENNDIDSIRHKASELGIIVEKNRDYTSKEIDFIISNYNLMSYADIAKKLNRTLSAIRTKISKLGFKINQDWTDENIALLKKYYPDYTNKYLCEKYFFNRTPESIRTMALKFGLHKSKEKSVKWYDENIMIQQLQELGNKLGRTPYGSELAAFGLPSMKTYERRFGGYRNACELAQLDANSSLYGESNIYYSLNNDLCFSKSELSITNYLINNSIEYKKEELYNLHCNDKRCGLKRVDWVINKSVFIEFFGMPEKPVYYKRMEEKRSICKDNNIKLIEIYRKDLTKLHTIFSQFL